MNSCGEIQVLGRACTFSITKLMNLVIGDYHVFDQKVVLFQLCYPLHQQGRCVLI